MSDQPSLDAALDAVLEAANLCLPGFDHVAVSLPGPKGGTPRVAASTETARQLRATQLELMEGPHVEVMCGVPMSSADGDSLAERWPRYAATATHLRSQLTVGLPLGDEQGTCGVLDLCSTRNSGIDPDVELVARLFAEHASIALQAARLEGDLKVALHTRSLIGKAVGIVMVRYELTDEAAFAYLTRVSSHSNTKIRDIAARLVDEACGEGQELAPVVPIDHLEGERHSSASNAYPIPSSHSPERCSDSRTV